MRFNEELPSKEELLDSPERFAIFITEKFCGDKWNGSLTDLDNVFFSDILRKISSNEINYRQLNEILMLLNQDTISSGYFEFIFEKEKISLCELLEGIKKIRGYFLLGFGNFRYPYKSFRNKSKSELSNILKKYCEKSENIIPRYQSRPDKMLEHEKIKKEDTWCLGYLSGAVLQKEGAELRKELEAAKKGESNYSNEELAEFGEYISKLEDKIIEC